METNQARAAILQRMSQALQTPSPQPHWLEEPIGTGPIFPLPEPNEQALRDRFRQEFEAIQGEWLEADSLETARAVLTDWLHRNEMTSLLAPESSALRSLLQGPTTVQWIERDNEGREGWDKLDVGVTLVDALVAESGTIAIGAERAGRAISVLPPTHLAVATADQLVADLDTALEQFRQRYPEQLPSSITFISGPSRTADIEKTLVLGAHGPRRLVLLLLPAGTFESA